MTKYRIYWLFQIIGWFGYSISQVIAYYYFNDTFYASQIFIEALMCIFNISITHLFRNIVVKSGLLEWKWPKLLPFVLFAIFLMTMCNSLLVSVFEYYWDPSSINTELDRKLFAGLEISAVYFLWTIIYFVFHYFERSTKSLQYEAAISEFELNNLKTQLNPHFIFNALNSIRALVDEDPKKSKQAITQLSNILRNSLILDKKKLISFEEELNTVKDYLELELVRYEERLNVDYDISPESMDFNIPPMMIQTLVENGIKHGVSQLTKGGSIGIKTHINNHTLVIQIRNSGQYLNGKSKSQVGLGIKNTIKRLDLIYSDQASFSIENENSDTVLTQIVIPETI